MNDVLKIFVQLRNKAHNTGENVGKLLAISTNEIPVSVFGMIFNKLTLGKQRGHGKQRGQVFILDRLTLVEIH